MKFINLLSVLLVFIDISSLTYESKEYLNAKDLNKVKEKKLKNYKMNPIDSLSYANSHDIQQKKLEFNVEIDLEKEVIHGKIRIFFKCLNNSTSIVLDVKSLHIKAVSDMNGNILEYSLIRNMNTSRAIGIGLEIKLHTICLKDAQEYIDISYCTTGNSIALHFSHPSMLMDKRYALMYSHGPAIFSRSIFPSQDTPSAKVLLEAIIRIASPYTVLFSGKLKNVMKLPNSTLEYHFRNDIPTSTYLVAFTAGVFAKRNFGDQCEVYAEVPFIQSEKIFNNFKDCSKYVDYYSNYLYPNPWGKIIFIIIPDDFPYGGMENPYGIHISKGILTSDGVGKHVVAHEIAHFWSGNLVTIQNWKYFWLNEGLTNFLYRKAFYKLYGKLEFEKELFLSRKKLNNFLRENKNNDDRSQLSLAPKIDKFDPYSHFSLIPYEKGFSFLYFINIKIGNKLMHILLQRYFKEFAFSTVTTSKFINLLKTILKENMNLEKASKIIEELKIRKWIYGTGKIPVQFKITSKVFSDFRNLVDKFVDNSYTLEEMISIFNSKDTYFRNTLLDKLARNTRIMSNSSQKIHQKFSDYYINNQNQLELEDSTLVLFYILRIKIEKDNFVKLKILLKFLRKVKYYHSTLLKRVFRILKTDLKLKKRKMLRILAQIGYRLNKLTIFRVMQFILKK